MSYSKIDIHYKTDGINTLKSVDTRQGVVKHKVISLPEKVQKYGDRYGYSSLTVTYSLDHVIIKGGSEVLLDRDINGTNNNEYIRSIVSYEWL